MSQSVSKDFKEFVKKTMGDKFKPGDYMNELDNAALYYMKAKGVNTHTHAHRKNQDLGLPPILQKYRDEMIQYLENKYGYSDLAKLYDMKSKGKQVLAGQFIEAINFVIGTDKRTVDKYLKLFQQRKIIKEIDGLCEFAPFFESEQSDIINKTEISQ